MSSQHLSPIPLLSRSAPSLRAVIGGLLVTLALLGVSQAYAQADDAPRSRMVVVDRDLPPGTVLNADLLEVLAVDLPPVSTPRVFDRVEDLVGARTLAPLAVGEPVLVSQVLPAGAGPPTGIDLSFAVSADRALGGGLRPGEQVDLVATPPAGSTRVVAERVAVVDVRGTTDALLAETDGLVVTVRLPSRRELLGVVAAVDEGRLTLARSSSEPIT